MRSYYIWDACSDHAWMTALKCVATPAAHGFLQVHVAAIQGWYMDPLPGTGLHPPMHPNSLNSQVTTVSKGAAYINFFFCFTNPKSCIPIPPKTLISPFSRQLHPIIPLRQELARSIRTPPTLSKDILSLNSTILLIWWIELLTWSLWEDSRYIRLLKCILYKHRITLFEITPAG